MRTCKCVGEGTILSAAGSYVKVYLGSLVSPAAKEA